MNREFTISVDKHRERVSNHLCCISSQVEFEDVERSVNFVKGALISMLGSTEVIGNDVHIVFKVVYEE